MTLHEDARRGDLVVPRRTMLPAVDGGSGSSRALVGYGSPSSATLPILFGREQELARLRMFVDGIAESGSSLLLSGELGVGKTRLLNAAAGLAEAAGYRVLTTDGYRSESHIEYAALHKLMLPLADGVAKLREPSRLALLTALGVENAPAPEPLHVFEAVLSILRAEAADRPLLVVVDDLEDLDRSTLSLFEFVARRLTGARIGLLAATVSDVDASRSGDGGDGVFGEQLVAQRLTTEAAEQLIEAIAPDLAIHVRERIVEQGDGNPLALVEFARGTRHALESDPDSLPVVLPSFGHQSFPFLVAGLPVATRRALLLLALADAADVAVLTPAELGVDALEPAEHDGLVAVDTGSLTVSFRHPLVRSAIVAQASSSERRQAHHLLASHLPDDVEKQAFHLAEASERADEDTAALLERAAHLALSRGDTGSAMRSLGRAAVLSPHQPDQQRRLARAAIVATGVAGDRMTASRLLSDSRLTREGPGALYAAIASALEQLMAGADTASANRIIRNAVEYGSHDWDASNAPLIEAMNTWLLICWSAGRADYWQALFDALDHLNPKPPEPLRTLAVAFADTARVTTREREQLAGLFQELGGQDDYALVLQLNTAALFLDLLSLGQAATWKLIETGRRGGSPVTYLRALGQMCLHDFAAGRWNEAEELAVEGSELAAAAESMQFSAMFFYTRGLIAAVRGDTEESARWIDRLDAITTPVDAQGIRRFGIHARVLAATASGDWERAYREAVTASSPGEFATFVPIALWVAYDLVEAAVRTGRVGEARAHHQAMLAENLSDLSPRLALVTAGAGALLAGPGEWREKYERALATVSADDWPFDYARVQLAYGARLRKERQPAEARAVIHRALDTFERLGAIPWADRARNELRIARERPESHAVGIDLTPQELIVAELAAEGLSNRQIGERMFLSARTVSGHLYRIFPKLGITHRSALRDALQNAEA